MLSRPGTRFDLLDVGVGNRAEMQTSFDAMPYADSHRLVGHCLAILSAPPTVGAVRLQPLISSTPVLPHVVRFFPFRATPKGRWPAFTRTISMSINHLAFPKAGFSLTCSYADYRQKAHVVPVVPTRDSNGRVKWECQDNLVQPDSFGSLRQFVFHCLRHWERSTGEKMAEAVAKEWVDQSVDRLLDPDHTRIDGLYFAVGPDNSVLILYRDDCGPLSAVSREAILGLVWHLEQDPAGT